MPRARAKARRDARTGTGSGAWTNPTEPSPVVENPCSSPDSAASCGIVSTSGAVTRLSLRAGLGAARAQDLLDLTLNLLEVHELPVDRREPDVGDLVEVAEAVHHHLADLPAGYLDASRTTELGLDVVDDGAQPLRRDVALFGRLLQAGEEFLRVEVLAAP